MEISKYFYLIGAIDAQRVFTSCCMSMRSVQFSENHVSPAGGWGGGEGGESVVLKL